MWKEYGGWACKETRGHCFHDGYMQGDIYVTRPKKTDIYVIMAAAKGGLKWSLGELVR